MKLIYNYTIKPHIMANLQSQKKWYVIVSKAIHYKKSATILERFAVPYYLPVQRQLRYWSDRKKWVNVPILSPYLFLFTTEQQRKVIFPSGNHFRFLTCEWKAVTVKEEEIEKIKLLCSHTADMKIEQHPLKKGELVEIIKGPLAGMNGYAVRENGKHRFLIQILSLGQFANVDVDSSWLKAC